jgi:ATP-binding cassette subfamily B protein
MIRPAVLRYREMLSKSDWLIIAGLAVANAACVGLMLFLIRNFIEALYLPGLAGTPFLLVLMAATSLSFGAARALEFTLPEVIGLRLVQQLRSRLYGHMAGLTPHQIQHRSRGSLILRLTGDLTMLRTWISRGLTRGLISGLCLLTCLAIIAGQDLTLAIAIGAIFGAGVALSVLGGRRLQRLTSLVRRRRSLLTSNIDEQVNALGVIQVFGRSRGEASRLDRQNANLTSALVREAKTRGRLRFVSATSGWLALTAACALGAWEVDAGELDAPAVVVMIIAARVMQSYVRALGMVHDYWRRAEVSRRKLDDFLSSRSAHLADQDRLRLRGRRLGIEFKDVNLASALRKFSAIAPAGRHVALVGPAGAGKSTVLHLLAQLVPFESGNILLGRTSMTDCRFSSLHEMIGIATPELPLLRGTMRRNLTYRAPQTDAEALEQLIQDCGLSTIIDSLPGKFDFWITEGGLNLTHSMRQQVALARAMCGQPPILLLDQAVTNISGEAYERILETIAHYPGTILMVTNDEREIGACDAVWSIDRGHLVSSEPPCTYFARTRPVREFRLALLAAASSA